MHPRVSQHKTGVAEANALLRIDELIKELDDGGLSASLMREHLDAAHFYLLGGMPHEYGISLQLAQESLPDVEDEGLRGRIANFIGTAPA